MNKKTKKSASVKRGSAADRFAEAKVYGIRITPRKLMLIVNLVRDKGVTAATTELRYSARKAAAGVVLKAIESAASNFSQKYGSAAELRVENIQVGKGITLKRFQPRSMGRAHPLMKKTSHLFVKVSEFI